jgi:NADP-dependent 3-hydroxy acid dehydrogenase YdfG
VSFEREACEFFDFEDISMNKRVALIVGAGPGISSAFGEALVGDGYRVALAARNLGKLRPLAEAMDAMPFEADASSTVLWDSRMLCSIIPAPASVGTY